MSFQFLWRYLREKLSDITPWQQRIKDIESHFGSVVSSYFIFLRWLFWMNFSISVILIVFVIVPELTVDPKNTGGRKQMLDVEKITAYNLKVPSKKNPTSSLLAVSYNQVCYTTGDG